MVSEQVISQYKVASVGTLRVKMNDGVIKILTNVKYIPELKKNLIFLGYLESMVIHLVANQAAGV